MRMEYRTARDWILAGKIHLSPAGCPKANLYPADDADARLYGWHCNNCDLHALTTVAEARNLGWSRIDIHERLMMHVRHAPEIHIANPTGSALSILPLNDWGRLGRLLIAQIDLEDVALLKQIDAGWPDIVPSKWERLRDG